MRGVQPSQARVWACLLVAQIGQPGHDAQLDPHRGWPVLL